MTFSVLFPFRVAPVRRLSLAILCVLGVGSLIGCSALDVENPTVIEGKNLDNATGASYLWTIARLRLLQAVNRSTRLGALLTDETFLDVPPSDVGGESYLDQRNSVAYEGTITPTNDNAAYGAWQQLRRDATLALDRAHHGPPAHRAELLALRAFAALRLAEDVCPGFPLREMDKFNPVYGPPLTTDQAFSAALVDLDSALMYADSNRVAYFVRIAKARALLGLGRFAEAGAMAETVPAGYIGETPFGENLVRIDELGRRDRLSVSNQEGLNGIDFIAAVDPRVVLVPSIKASNHDTTFMRHAIAMYPYSNRYAPIVVASSVEARLIEAEAQLQPATNPSGPWLATLNALRATVALPDTTDPGTAEGRIDLLFRERAFWLFATGHRLGDLRRLISRYGRAAESVFPTGMSWGNKPYGTATSMPFNATVEHSFNAAVTGCTSR